MLTQAEIDALLSGAIELEKSGDGGSINLAELMGETPAAPREKTEKGRNISTYNFWSPDRFSKEQMRAVELVHEDLAERLATSLPTILRTNLKPRLVHTEQGRFHDFLKDMPPNSLYHMIILAPLPGRIVLTFSPNIDRIMLEQLLGGKLSNLNRKDRPLTDIDQSLLRDLVENMLNDIKAAWSKVVSIEPTLEDSTINQHWVQMFMGNERVMCLTFEMTIQNTTGTMSIYIPFSTLKPIANDLNPHVWISGRKEKQIDPVARQIALENLHKVYLPVNVWLGSCQMRLHDVLNLQVGDVIVLDTSIYQDLTVQIAHKDKFYGQIGKVGKYLAVKITGKINDPA
ncbi:MAG: flagellar motor switch protein FliM [Thermanaerothrix sp.]|jgi:flagellar motor switch protein FliM|uniref:Flagellar motor switch protein FliM n=1 Tax=Thermanaerothrix solaris TaxID=3058434 RepID=A0ABU3NLE7_9CHLR|nr:flagellar motor switch protein FliM [Thermanaerothrix sp. 4228-RoL]MDT8897652.1 flagellar motor switch protein FliM [Thermanaerothrix sp. 4228-RoL]